MNDVQIFSNPEFGDIRTLTISGEPWVVGKDAARMLGYSNTKDALAKHVDPEDKQIIQRSENTTFEIPNRGLTIINESGLYALIFGSKLESAKRFKCWVTHEVLPAIRKTGRYSVTPQRREITLDDYMKAAQLAATCRNERLPYVLGFLEQAGLTIPNVAPPPVLLDDTDCAAVFNRLMQESGITQTELCRRTNISKASISYYVRGVHKPSPERYQLIISALS